MKLIINLFCLCISFVILNCQPACDVEVSILNNSDHTLDIISIGFQEADSVQLVPDSLYLLFQEDGICTAPKSKWKFSNLCDSLLVYLNDTLVYHQIPIDRPKWFIDEETTDKGWEKGRYLLILTNDSLSISNRK